MKILGFDTATSACSVALSINGEIREQTVVVPQRHAEIILSMIEKLLGEAGVSLRQLNAIAFGQGPGSFMGVRIAAGVAQGLAYGADLPVVPVSTLRILAQTAYQQTGHKAVISAWDARMQAIYWGIYRLNDSGIMCTERPDALNPPGELDIPSETNWLLAGNAWQVYQQELKIPIHAYPQLTDIYPQARAILPIAEELMRNGEARNPMEIEPVYLRNDIAHVKKC
jgi:tRNA threonylcarbamoyladenosine biosynthesis protein TsaB